MPSPVENDTIVAGRYTLERCISTGGIGALWLARDEQTGESCALRLADGTGQNVDILELSARYRAEFEIMDRIRCENVVDVIDYGDWRGMPYLVSEYLQGEDLATRLRREGELSTERAYRLLAQTARALARAHGAGIVHGDVSPENILVTEEGPQGVAKIHNFSLTQRTSEKIVGTVTRMGSFLALPHYASPEQAAGAELDARSDLWSLAVIAYECLTGRKPFESNVYGDLVAKILCGPIPALRVGSCNNPSALQVWWERACARDPSKRFQSSKQLSDALGQVFDVPIVYVPESNPNGVVSGSSATPEAILGTPEQSQVARRTQSFPRIPRRSTPLGIGAVNPNLGAPIPPASSSAQGSFSQMNSVASVPAFEHKPVSPLPEISQISEEPKFAPDAGAGPSADQLSQRVQCLEESTREADSEFPESEAPTVSRQQSLATARVPLPVRLAPKRMLYVAAAALLALAGLLLTQSNVRAWLKGTTSGSNSTTLSEHQAGISAVLLPAPPSAPAALGSSPIVPMPAKDSVPPLERSANHVAVPTSAASSAELSVKEPSKGVAKRAVSDVSSAKVISASAARSTVMNPKGTVAVPTAPSASGAMHDSVNPNAARPVKPAATSNTRDYGI